MLNKAWRIIPRPLLETVLNNHVQHHRVPQPLILHGPRGVGKTTLIVDRKLLFRLLSFSLSLYFITVTLFSPLQVFSTAGTKALISRAMSTLPKTSKTTTLTTTIHFHGPLGPTALSLLSRSSAHNSMPALSPWPRQPFASVPSAHNKSSLLSTSGMVSTLPYVAFFNPSAAAQSKL